MTLEEANKVAEKRLPVRYHEVLYMCIDMIGYKYDGTRRYPFVRLRDWNGKSFTDAMPSMCEIGEGVANNE